MNKSFHILVADDNKLNQQVLLGMLEHAGYSVDLANDGREAIKCLTKTRYDLLILDCMMPNMDGFESAQTIRNSEKGIIDPNIPILGVTALSTSEDHEKCLSCGMSMVITKPVAAKVLFSCLEEMLQRTPTGQKHAVKYNNGQDAPTLPVKEAVQNNPVNLVQILRSMSPTIIRDAELWIVALARLQDARDFQQLSGLAHKIRGTADLLNDLPISALARSLEETIKAEDEAVADSLTISLIVELKRLKSELEVSSRLD